MNDSINKAAEVFAAPDEVPASVRAEATELCRSAEVLPGAAELARRIARARQAGRSLRVKLGVDPTGSQLHLGHTVVLRRLRLFQDFGHQAVLIIGGFTARIGDPTGRNSTRPSLTAEEVAANAAGFLEQVRGILDCNRLEVRNNNDWLEPLGLADLIALAGTTTVNRLIAKDSFGQRIEAGQPVGLHELLYPLLQARDSVEVQADVEIGGTDQRFNILQGRDLQAHEGQEPQVALMLPILEGTDGKRKMSKTFGNAICLSDTADDIFAKTMRIPDELIGKFFDLATDLDSASLSEIRQRLAAGTENMKLKMLLARRLVLQVHGESAAEKSMEGWHNLHSLRQAPQDVAMHTLPAPVALVSLLVQLTFASSNNRARDLIKSGAVRINGEKVQDISFTVSPTTEGVLLQAGKRQFVRLTSVAQ